MPVRKQVQGKTRKAGRSQKDQRLGGARFSSIAFMKLSILQYKHWQRELRPGGLLITG